MGIESRPLWKPMHKQPVYKNCPAYVNGVSESLFKVGLCLPSGPYVTDGDVAYIVDCIKRIYYSYHEPFFSTIYLVLFQEILTLLGYYLAGLLLDLIFRLIGVYLE